MLLYFILYVAIGLFCAWLAEDENGPILFTNIGDAILFAMFWPFIVGYLVYAAYTRGFKLKYKGKVVYHHKRR